MMQCPGGPPQPSEPSPYRPPPPPSWRKPCGIFVILTLIAVWMGLVIGFSDQVLVLGWPLQLGFFLLTGIIWIAPLKPLLRWMEGGPKN